MVRQQVVSSGAVAKHVKEYYQNSSKEKAVKRIQRLVQLQKMNADNETNQMDFDCPGPSTNHNNPSQTRYSQKFSPEKRRERKLNTCASNLDETSGAESDDDAMDVVFVPSPTDNQAQSYRPKRINIKERRGDLAKKANKSQQEMCKKATGYDEQNWQHSKQI